ncbi:MAG: CCA tRNA nucleotidyltransferase [Kocuria sp.]|nr:CCA tRNA nucleotidyltransferase [Kocuria sp.]
MTQLLDTSTVPPVVLEAGRLFEAAGYDLSLVGGPVRDLFLGRLATDLDFTTNATPDQTLSIIAGWADAVWEIGRDFGTIGMRRGNAQLEITTYRAEAYDAASRKPTVAFGTELAEDLVRRDFTVNAMALRLPSLELVDLHGGVLDLHAKVLRTPGTPEASFDDDPLRMMRAARFASQLGMDISPEVLRAMRDMAKRLEIVSAERIRDELVKLINGVDPRRGVEIMVDTGIADIVLPEVPALKLETDSAHRHKDVYQHSLTVMQQAVEHENPEGPVPGPDFPVRFAALMHDVGKPATRRFGADGSVTFRHHDTVGAKITRKRMKALRFDNDTIKTVTRLVELHMRFYGYADAGWTDSAVRRYVRDAGDQLERLHILTRSDVTTRNKRKAQRLDQAYSNLERRIAALAEEEQLAAVRPELDGTQIMEILGIGPSRAVGQAYNFLLELRLDEGVLGQEEAASRLLTWWETQQESTQPTADDS